MVLGALFLAASWVCAVAIVQDRANTLHSYALKEWATPAKLNTCSRTGITFQNPASQTKILILLPVAEKQFQPQSSAPSFPSMGYSAAFIGQIPFMQCDLTSYLIQCNCRLLQKLFPAPQFSCIATGFSCHCIPFRSLHHSADSVPRASYHAFSCLSGLFGSGYKYWVKLVPVSEKSGFCMI